MTYIIVEDLMINLGHVAAIERCKGKITFRMARPAGLEFTLTPESAEGTLWEDLIAFFRTKNVGVVRDVHDAPRVPGG
jgi:hypothetical protein